ncbi:protein of unknown function [Rhizobiales bacterium GAS188]|nr:protein of unknown function [Rhizobiales bacterium GAS188]
MQIVANFDQSTATLPVGFVSAVNYVASYFDSLFTSNVTVTIDVGFGEIHGQSLPRNALGASLPVLNGSAGFIPFESYGSVRNALIAQNAPGAITLPTSAPVGAPANLVTTQAEAKALGLMTNSGSLDGYVGFSSSANIFSYTPNATPPSNEYYFVGVVEHEFSEIMGRISALDISAAYSAMDLFRYSGANTRQFTTGASSYFSVNSGLTNLDNWNNFQTGNSGDLGDWAPSAGNDAFNDNSSPGVINALTPTDVTLMGALGWASAPPGQNLFGATTHDVTSPGGDIYAFYQAIFGHPPDPLGFEYWTAQLDAGMSVSSIAQDFLASSEYTSKYGPYTQSSDSAFINQLYVNALHHQADPSSLAYWDNSLEIGNTRTSVAIDIALSSEAQGDLAPVFQSQAGVFVPSEADSQIARLYYGLFNHAPDPNGLAYWENSFAQGEPLVNIATDFINSAEYAAKFGTLDNAQFVTALYEGALGRSLDPIGGQYWINSLDQGASRPSVAINIAESSEATDHLSSQIEAGFKLA